MRAIVVTEYGGPDVLAVTELPDPAPGRHDVLADLPSGVQLSTFASAFVLGNDDYPVACVPLQELIAKAERGDYRAKPARVFAFDEIVEAHRVMERNEARGKLVVTVGRRS